MAITRQKLYSIFRKAGYDTAKFERSGMVRGWGSWSSGVQVKESQEAGAEWQVEYVFGGRASDAEREAKLLSILSVLTEAGIQCRSNAYHSILFVGGVVEEVV